MATDEQGRQLSEDGYYYWDGTAWQPVNQGAGSGDSAGAGGSAGTGSAASPQEAFAAALSQSNIHLDASAVQDMSAVEAGLSSAWNWYHSLDSTTMSAIDAATTEPGQASVALSEAGVASGIDSLLEAFDQVSGSLGELLTSAYQAFNTVHQSS